MSTFDESKIRRGQPNNRGQFAAKGNSRPGSRLSVNKERHDRIWSERLEGYPVIEDEASLAAGAVRRENERLEKELEFRGLTAESVSESITSGEWTEEQIAQEVGGSSVQFYTTAGRQTRDVVYDVMRREGIRPGKKATPAQVRRFMRETAKEGQRRFDETGGLSNERVLLGTTGDPWMDSIYNAPTRKPLDRTRDVLNEKLPSHITVGGIDVEKTDTGATRFEAHATLDFSDTEKSEAAVEKFNARGFGRIDPVTEGERDWSAVPVRFEGIVADNRDETRVGEWTDQGQYSNDLTEADVLNRVLPEMQAAAQNAADMRMN